MDRMAGIHIGVLHESVQHEELRIKMIEIENENDVNVSERPAAGQHSRWSLISSTIWQMTAASLRIKLQMRLHLARPW